MTASPPSRGNRFAHLFPRVLAVLCVVWFALYFVHLRADFPNGSPWNDWSKTTDEGWYASGAVHFYTYGHWYQPGAFNPAIPMPVWSFLALLWFAVTGFGIVQLRVLELLVFAASMLMLWSLLKRPAGNALAVTAVALIVFNPFSYSFHRLAILEPVLVFFTLLCWLLARRAAVSASILTAVALGLSATALLLTKSTGAVLLPSVACYFILCGIQAGESRWPLLRRGAIAVAAMVLSFGAYEVAVRHYRADSRLLFVINNYRVHLSIVPRYLWLTLRDGIWIHPVLFPLAVLSLLLSLVWLRNLWRIPLFSTAVLAAAGYLAFILYHSNLQPRYYLVAAPSVSIVIVLSLHELFQRNRQAARGVAIALGVVTFAMAWQSAQYMLHPQYTFLSAMQGIRKQIVAHPETNQMIVSNSGDEISLFTGLPAICEAYSTLSPEFLLITYRPGWFAHIEGDKPSRTREFILADPRLSPVATYNVFDDPEHHELKLYRMPAKQ